MGKTFKVFDSFGKVSLNCFWILLSCEDDNFFGNYGKCKKRNFFEIFMKVFIQKRIRIYICFSFFILYITSRNPVCRTQGLQLKFDKTLPGLLEIF